MRDFNYGDFREESIACNLCGLKEFKRLAKRDHDGLKLSTVICRKCGLIFINPRMSKDGYREYYQNEYRSKAALHGKSRLPNLEKMFNKGVNHGEELLNIALPYVNLDGLTVEVGSSVGGILYGMKKILKGEVIGVEPSETEANYANSKGVKTYISLIEDFELKDKKLPKFSNIVCTQSLNHFLDPAYFFSWSYKNLVDSGRLIIEVMNFRHQAKKAGSLEGATHIDHPYMFTPEVLEDFLTSAGFDVLFFDVDEEKGRKILSDQKNKKIPNTHIRAVAKKSSRPPFAELVIKSDNYQKGLKSLNKFKLYIDYLINYRFR